MKYIFVLALISMLLFGCSDDPVGSGIGYITIESFDAPAPEGVEHIYLHVLEVSAHNSDDGWFVISQPDTVIDYLELVNGVTVLLADSVTVPAGNYQQMRLLLADSNQIVIDSITYDLITPSAQESGVKINLNFAIEDDELIEIYIDFDIAESVVSTSTGYLFKPTFRAFKQTTSGTISGTVLDTLGAPLEDITISATGIEFSTSTITDSTGNYQLILPADTYNLSAMADSLTADTTYTDIVLNAEDELTGFDFTME